MNYKKALRVAAEDAYKSEVVDTEMESMTIGDEGEYASRDEWIQTRIDDWLERARS